MNAHVEIANGIFFKHAAGIRRKILSLRQCQLRMAHALLSGSMHWHSKAIQGDLKWPTLPYRHYHE